MKLVSEFPGGNSEISKAEISGLLRSYGGKILGENKRLIFFSTDRPDEVARRVAFSKRIGRIIENERIELPQSATYSIREEKGNGKPSLIEEVAKKIRGRVNLDNPDFLFHIYNFEEPIIAQVIHERKMKELIDPRYYSRPFNHPSSISPMIARGMLNIAGVRESERFVDPFAGTGTYLIEGYRMGIIGFGIDRNPKMVEGGNRNLRHFGFPPNIVQGDFADLTSIDDLSAIVTDPPYGRGSKIFSQSRETLYQRLFSLISRAKVPAVFCIPSISLLDTASEYIDLKVVASIRVHSSLTRYIAISK